MSDIATMLRDALPIVRLECEVALRAELDDEGEIDDALNIWQTGYEHAMTLVGEWQR